MHSKKFFLIGIMIAIVAIVVVTSSVMASPQPKVNVCHKTNSESNPWEAIAVDQNSVQTHLDHGDFLYNGPVKNNGQPTNDGNAWCDQNAPQPPTPVPTEEPTQPPPTDEGIMVEICHVTGNGWEDITVNENAVDAHLAHGDFLVNEQNPCPPQEPPPPPPPTDVCPNLDGVQATVPDGMVQDEQGNCVTPPPPPPPPTDVCPNLDGVQESVPDGMIVDDGGNCVTPPPPPPIDVCPNLDGVQATMPDGYQSDEQGNCVPVPPPPPQPVPGCTDPAAVNFNPDANQDDGSCQYPPPPPPGQDVCPNLDGVQESVPDGMIVDNEGNCVPNEQPPTDVCPNIDGIQATVPEGMHKDDSGNCVEDDNPTPPPPPPHRPPKPTVHTQQGYIGPGADEITVVMQGHGPTYPDIIFVTRRSTNDGWSVVVDKNGQPIVYSVGGNPAIEFRDRFNRDQNAEEKFVPFARLVLGPNNKDLNPEHYRAIDAATYLATGEMVFVNVWTSVNDEHAQLEDGWGGSYPGDNYNWVTGVRSKNGVPVK